MAVGLLSLLVISAVGALAVSPLPHQAKLVPLGSGLGSAGQPAALPSAVAGPLATPVEQHSPPPCDCYGSVATEVSGVPQYWDPGSGCNVSDPEDPNDTGACQVLVPLNVVSWGPGCAGVTYTEVTVWAGVQAGRGHDSFPAIDTCGTVLSYDDYECTGTPADGCGIADPVAVADADYVAPPSYDPTPYVVNELGEDIPLSTCVGATVGIESNLAEPIDLEFTDCAAYLVDAGSSPANGTGDDTGNGTATVWTDTGFDPCETGELGCAADAAGYLTIESTGATVAGLPCTTCLPFSSALFPLTYAEEANLTLFLPQGSYYWVEQLANQSGTPTNGSLVIGTAPTVVAGRLAPVYSLTFRENGLPTGASWSVGESGTGPGGVIGVSATTSEASLTVPVANGSVPYLVLGPSGYAVTGGGAAGTVIVSGNTTVVLSFAKATTGTLTVRESGLPRATYWCAGVGPAAAPATYLSCGTTAALPVRDLPTSPTAALHYLVLPVPGAGLSSPGGNLTVAARNATEKVRFTVSTVPVTFVETGLPAGTRWALSAKFCGACGVVDLRGKAASAEGNGSSLTLDLGNGSFNWSVRPIRGYAMEVGGGIGWKDLVGVYGAAETVHLLFYAPVTFPLTFSESGLPVGTAWTVTVGGVSESAMTSTIAVPLPNGTYRYVVGNVSGFVASGTPVTAKVRGTAAMVSVLFTPVGGTTAGSLAGTVPVGLSGLALCGVGTRPPGKRRPPARR